jgi:hypothetical protein
VTIQLEEIFALFVNQYLDARLALSCGTAVLFTSYTLGEGEDHLERDSLSLLREED